MSPKSQHVIFFSNTPKLVDCLSRRPIHKVACGLNHAVAVTKNSGKVYSWGCGAHGQLGLPAHAVSDFNSPAKVPFFECSQLFVRDVAAGGKHTLYLTD